MVKVCEVLGCTTTENQKLWMHKFPAQNAEHQNAWIAWITRNRPGWRLKSNSRVCQLHFVPEDYVKSTKGKGIRQKLKKSAIPSLQVEEIEDTENHCKQKTARRFLQTAQYLRGGTNTPIGGKEIENEHAYCLKVLTCGEVQDFLEVEYNNEGEELQPSIGCLKDEHSDVTHEMKTMNNESTSCSTPPIKHPLSTIRVIPLSALVQEDIPVSVAQKDCDNDRNIQLDATTGDILDSKNQETLQTNEALLQKLEEKDNIIESLKKQIAAKDLSLQSIKQLYKVTKKNYFVEKKRLKRLREYHLRSHEGVSTILRPDQIRALSQKTTKGLKWSLATITDALEFKYRWGTRGYDAFVKRVPIYPTARTLQRKFQHV